MSSHGKLLVIRSDDGKLQVGCTLPPGMLVQASQLTVYDWKGPGLPASLAMLEPVEDLKAFMEDLKKKSFTIVLGRLG